MRSGIGGSKWIVSFCAMVLVGGLGVVSVVTADDDKNKNPFTQILNKLNEILTKLNSGGGEGNHTLRWDQVLPAAQRFVVLAAFNNDAVLDKETGLVWEKSPTIETHDWRSAQFQCNGRTTGGRKGWRLPSVHELASLVDPSVFLPGPTLPPGHPFLNVQSSFNHWSASTVAVDPTFAWYVSFYKWGRGPRL